MVFFYRLHKDTISELWKLVSKDGASRSVPAYYLCVLWLEDMVSSAIFTLILSSGGQPKVMKIAYTICKFMGH